MIWTNESGPQPDLKVLPDSVVTLVVVLEVVAVDEGLAAAHYLTGEGSLVAVDSTVFLQVTLGSEDLLTVHRPTVESLS